MKSPILWTPASSSLRESNLAVFSNSVGVRPEDYETLHRWSVSDKGAFWSAVWDFAGIVGDKGDRAFVPNEAHPMTKASFFPEATLNLTENMLVGDDKQIVVTETDEQGHNRSYDRRTLRSLVARTANGLRAAGVEPGDRVAGVLPNRIENLVALLATIAVGGVWSSCSPDFGVAAITDRIGQIEPKVLFAVGSYRYGSKTFETGSRIQDIAAALPSIKQIVHCGGNEIATAGRASVTSFADFGTDGPLEPSRQPFSHPVYVLYTSGTTGAPKAIVHSAGGVLLQHLKEHLLHGDVRPADRLLWYTNTAWMMFHWMVSVLACRAGIVLYDGAPILKREDGLECGPLWRACDENRVSHLGISPKYLATLAAESYRPADHNALEELRWLMSAGAPVAPDQFDWVYQNVKTDLGFASICGGTEILGCFLLGSPIHPVRRGELTTRALGLDVHVFDDRNAPVIGQRGDLVCTEPFPSMPLTFWGEGGLARYHDTYFSERREIWTHGDIAEIAAEGSAIVHGRSDATIKPGGVRIGSAEVYAACEKVPEVEDAIVFGALHDGDEEVVLGVKLRSGSALNEELAARLRREIRELASPFHVPRRIHQVRDIPYTLNGKRVEKAVKSVVAGEPV
ncbi:MAG: acetoacetate--CoA ligase, partial [Pseudomonadota bacterium]